MHAMIMTVLSAKISGAGRTAQRVGHERLVETIAVLHNHLLDVRQQPQLEHRIEDVGVQIVGHDHHKIRPGTGLNRVGRLVCVHCTA